MSSSDAVRIGRAAIPGTRSTAAPRTSAGLASLDIESRRWLDSLSSGDIHVRDGAIAMLHALLLRAARFEVARRRATAPHLHGRELDDLALQSADDALVAVLAKLDRFKGQSRFTTWAYKFGLLEASVKMRRRPWQGRELPLEDDGWARLEDERAQPSTRVECRELLAAVQGAIETELTAHQREILVAVALNGVPIDVLAEKLGSTRGALYKTVHDARRKLRLRLRAEGHTFSLKEPPSDP
jgi:RNA polymerase sigma-70 factor, ECF subfamily